MDETQNDETQQMDTESKPEENEKPADETMAEKPAEETMAEKPEDAQQPESEATRTNVVARKLDISNGETVAESETGKTA